MSKKLLLSLGVALVVGVLLGILLSGGKEAPAPLPSGEVSNMVYELKEGAVLGDARTLTVSLTLEGGEQAKLVKVGSRTGGRNVELVEATMSTIPDPRVSGSVGTASTTFMGFMGTSSTATLSGGPGLSVMEGGAMYASDTPFTNTTKNLPFGGIIDGVVIATSTVATTTSSLDPGIVSTKYGRDNASGSHQISETSHLYLFLTAGFDQPDIAGCNSQDEVLTAENSCETATSSARGFNLVGRFTLRLL